MSDRYTIGLTRSRWQVRRRPEDASAWLAYGYALYRADRHEESHTAAQSAVQYARTVEQALDAADLFDALSQPELAFRATQAAARLDGSNLAAQDRLGERARALGHQEVAVNAAWQALALQPGDVPRARVLGMALLKAGRAEEAVQVLDRVAQHTHDVDCYLALGRAHTKCDEGAQAIRALRTAALLAPERLDVVLALVTSLTRQGTHRQALTLVNRVRNRWPESVELVLNAATILADLDDIDGALAEIETARALRPDLALIDRNRGAILFKGGRYDEAAAAFRRASERAPDDAYTHIQLAAALRYQHRNQEAQRELERAIELAPAGKMRQQAQAMLAVIDAPPMVPAEAADSSVDAVDFEMVMSGTLSRFPIMQLLETLRGNSATGTLLLSASKGLADLRVNDGRLVAANCSILPRLGERLVADGAVQRAALESLLSTRRTTGAITPVGSMMIAAGLISPDQLRVAVTAQIKAVINEVVRWTEGTFILRHLDASVLNEGPLQGGGLRIEGVLLDAVRLLDEARAER